jgi:hypothetical protein
MNYFLDQQACANCKMCYRRNTPWCRDNCRRCGVAMFSDDEVNVYPYLGGGGGQITSWPYTPNYPNSYPSHSPTPKSFGRLYYNYPRVTNQYYPSMLPYANYYGSLYRPSISYW